MRKFLKWFIFGLVLTLGVALLIGYCFFGDKTKAIVDVVIDYINRPLGIVCGTTITLGLVFYFVFSYVLQLSRDKAKLDREDFETRLAQKDKEHKEELNKLNEKIKELESSIESAKEQGLHLKETITLIPNKKVQERLGQFYGEERTND